MEEGQQLDSSPASVNISPATEATETKVVEETRQIVESALRKIQKSGRDIENEINEVAGDIPNYYKNAGFIPELSTEKSHSHLRTGEGEDNDFLSMCYVFTAILEVALQKAAIPFAVRKTPSHTFLSLTKDGVNVFVDPSIGQLVKDHTQIFVGTQQQLVDVVTNAYNNHQLVNTAHYASEDSGTFSSPNPPLSEILTKFWGVDPQ